MRRNLNRKSLRILLASEISVVLLGRGFVNVFYLSDTKDLAYRIDLENRAS
jgi:hypothetical protein